VFTVRDVRQYGNTKLNIYQVLRLSVASVTAAAGILVSASGGVEHRRGRDVHCLSTGRALPNSGRCDASNAAFTSWEEPMKFPVVTVAALATLALCPLARGRT
jgi:hypothetical protein